VKISHLHHIVIGYTDCSDSRGGQVLQGGTSKTAGPGYEYPGML
jgi:hypothetical protein